MADMTLAQLQALVEQQGAELAKLKAAAAATTPAPTEYYTLTKTGEEIDEILAGGGGVNDAVRYGEPQSLTDGQKTQARGNIGAAPGGFGLGTVESKQISSWDDAIANGWYSGPAPAGIGSGSLWGRVDALSAGYAIQTIYSDTYIAVVQRFRIGATWEPWEWVNPPMELGVEYRTTERHLGKPVYCKLVDCGAIVEGKIVDLGLNNPAAIISVDAVMNNAPSPAFYTASGLGIYGNSYYVDYYNGTPRTGSIMFHIGSGQPQGYVKVKYIKTTD